MHPKTLSIRKDYVKAFRSYFDAGTCNTLQPQSFFVDVHCHTTFMPFNRQGKYRGLLSDQVHTSIKEFWPKPGSPDNAPRWLLAKGQRFENPPTFYQSDFTALARGNVRVAFVSLLPLEQGFVHAGKGGLLETVGSVGEQLGIPVLPQVAQGAEQVEQVLEDAGGMGEQLGIKLLPEEEMVAGKLADLKLGEAVGMLGAAWVTKIPMSRTEHVQAKEHDYFNDLKAEYELLANKSYWKCPGRPGVPARAEAQVVGNFGELKPLLDKPNITAAIVTVEGGHSLGCGSLKWLEKIEDSDLDAVHWKMDDLLLDEDSFITPTAGCRMVTRFQKTNVRELVLQLLKHIQEIKGWGPGGKFAPFFLTFSHHFWNQLCGHAISLPWVFNQKRGIEVPITEVGKVVLSALLSKKNGRRVLIDTKHMSLAGKHWYYGRIKGRNIPIISSHAAYNGKTPLLAEASNTNCGVARKNYRNSTYFNPWDINLSGQEIQTIHQLDGLVGLNFDERILTGQERNHDLHNRAPRRKGRNPDVWVEPLADHLCRFAAWSSQCGDAGEWKDYWRHVAIGSDFDGAINPIDGYCWAGDFKDLETHLVDRLVKMAAGAGPVVADNPLQGRSKEDIEQIVDGFLRQNALDFLAKYFTDAYRT